MTGGWHAHPVIDSTWFVVFHPDLCSCMFKVVKEPLIQVEFGLSLDIVVQFLPDFHVCILTTLHSIRLKVLLSNPKSNIVGDLPMTAGKDGVDVLETGDFLLMELRFDFVMLCFQSGGNELNHFRETSLKIEEVGFDVCV